MAKPDITFYDIETKIPGLPTSANTWRVRLTLNYKNLPYKTVWSEGPDIAATCIAAGIPPSDKRADGSPHYTMPGLVDLTRPDAPVHLTDSRVIIDYLEATYPSPEPQRALFPPGTRAFQALADNYVERNIIPLSNPLIVFKMSQKQTDRSQPGYKAYTPAGKTLEEVDPRGKEREEAWTRVRAEFDKIGAYAEGDVFYSGDYLRYFDIHLLAALLAIKLSIGDEEFEKELGTSAGGRWAKLLKACAELVR